ncbi:MAG TPA: hypothetical protein VF875_12565 [Anaeromyxobacter sp.]
MRPPLRPLALVPGPPSPRAAGLGRGLALFALAALAGCVKPAGSCHETPDCASGETCDGGVCVRTATFGGGGGGSGGGIEPTAFTSVAWSALQGSPGATFRPDSVGADSISGDVVVAGALDGAFAPWGLGTGAFVAKVSGLAAFDWAFPFPTFSHGKLRAAVLPGGDVLFAATALAPTTIGGLPPITPPAQGALVVGRLDAAGNAIWAVSIPSASASATLVPVAAAVLGSDLLVAGTGAGDFGCGATAGQTFVAALAGANGACLWSRGFATRSIADAEPRDAGDVLVAGICAPTGAYFDPQGGTTCTSGLWVAALSGSTGATLWATTGSGAVSAVRDVAVAPDGSLAVVGDATGSVRFGGAAAIDFGPHAGSFAARFAADGTPGAVIRPIEAPYALLADAASFDRCAADRLGKLWIAGRYRGQPTLGGALFPECRLPACAAATYLARLEGDGSVSSFLPLRVAPLGDGSAFVDDLVLFATTGTLAHALRLTGSTSVGGASWTSVGGGDLGVLRIAP